MTKKKYSLEQRVSKTSSRYVDVCELFFLIIPKVFKGKEETAKSEILQNVLPLNPPPHYYQITNSSKKYYFLCCIYKVENYICYFYF